MSAGDDRSAATTEATSGSVRGAGLRLHYLEWGTRSELAGNRTILFLHGGGLNAHTWTRVADSLRDAARCVALDLRGHGDSDWAPDGDYGLDAHAADVASVVQELGLIRVVLVGMSLGGSIATTVGGRHPDGLEALVLVDNGPGGSRAEGRRRIGSLMDGHQEYSSIDDAVAKAMESNPRRSRERLRRNVELNMRQLPQGTWTWKWDPRIRWRAAMTADEAEQFISARSARQWEAAATVECPVLVVRGGRSDMFLEDDARRTVAGFRDARLVTIPGAGHTVQSEQPVLLAEAIRAFLDSTVDAVGSG